MTALIDSASPETDTVWIFKSYKQLAKICFRQQKYPEVLAYIEKIIPMLPKLNGNYAEESISKLLARYSACPNSTFVNQMHERIISYLENSQQSGGSGQRMWLKININRLNHYVDSEAWAQCVPLIKAINARLESVSGMTRNLYGLDVLAAEIACEMKQGADIANLTRLHRRSKEVYAAITHPKVTGIIKECGATIQFFRQNYEEARVAFYESFKSYDEAGLPAKRTILKYLGLCSLLTDSEVNPFQSQETQAYALLPEYKNLIGLTKSYENQDLAKFVAITQKMKNEADPLASDKIFQTCEVEILQNLKQKLFANLVESYSALKYDTVIRKLQLSGDDELEDFVISMANSGIGANVRLNFTARIVEIPKVSSNIILPEDLDAQKVFVNRNVVQLLEYRGIFGNTNLEPMAMDTSPDIPATTADPEANMLNEETKGDFNYLRLNKLVAEAENWLNYMKSALPLKSQHVVSQKDQVFSEQQEGSKLAAQNENKTSNDTSEESATGGILGANLDYANHMDEEDEEENPSKLAMLERWSVKLSNELYLGKTKQNG